jgi:hypothetical protein
MQGQACDSFGDTLRHSLSHEFTANGWCEKCGRTRRLIQRSQIKHPPNIFCLAFSLKDEVRRPPPPTIISCTHIALELLTTLFSQHVQEWQTRHEEGGGPHKWIPPRYVFLSPSCFVLLRFFFLFPSGGFISWLVISGSSSRRRSWEIPLLWRNATATINQRALGQRSMN